MVLKQKTHLAGLAFKQQGFSLLEVLISVLVLSVGLLGLAALQTTSLKNNHSAHYRTSATVLAYDIIDRMRINPGADYTRNIGDAQPPAGSTVNDDLREWTDTLSRELPGGDGAIAIAGDIITITVQWDDSRGDDSISREATGYDGTRNFIVRTQR